MIRIFKLFGFLILLTLSCTTKNGTEFTEKYGQLWIVSTEADSARIFLDYRDTGSLTPSLIKNITPGKHVIHLFHNGYRTNPDSVIVLLQEDQSDTVSIELLPAVNGDLFINSSPDSARVILNRLEFGITPITIEGLPAGIYFLELVKSGFNVAMDTVEILENDHLRLIYQLAEDLRRLVLLEHFSNVSCPPCPTCDEIIHDLAESYGPSRLVVLGYHANYPSPSDPMYLAARAANDRRIQFYQPASLPRAYVDGRLVSDPLSSSCYLNLIEDQLLSDTLAFIAFQQLNWSEISVKGQLKVKALSDIQSDNHLFIALIEDEIHYNTPPGTNGQTHFTEILRAFYPDGNGISLNLMNQQSQTFDFEITLTAEWGRDLTVSAFIQDVSSKAVLQAAWTRYPEF